MKNITWALVGIAIIAVVVYFAWSREQRVRAPNDAVGKETPASSFHNDYIALALSNLNQSFSIDAHDPTALESALIIRDVSPQTAASLLQAYQQSPERFEQDEASSLILATIFLDRNKLDEYQKMFQKWEERSTYPGAWFALNADFLLMQGKKDEAIAHLSTREFSGPQDVPRLMRLAMLNQELDYDSSLRYLNLAKEKDPDSTLLPILNSRLYEKANKITEAAQELSKSMKSNEKKSLSQVEALADLFNRYGYQPFAMSIWTSFEGDLPKETAAKALFWQRVLASAETPQKISSGGSPYLEYLADIPKGQFWNEKAFEKLSDAQYILETHQEAYWLRVLDFIAKGKEANALSLIQNSPFKSVSWNPQMEAALEIALNKHLNQSIDFHNLNNASILDKEYGTSAWLKPEDNQFIMSLIETSEGKDVLSAEDLALLDSKNVFSAILMAEGWQNAALHLYQAKDPAELPEWYSVELTKILANEKGVHAALDFALQEKDTPLLTLQIGELYFTANKPEDALKVLEQLRTENSEAGARAAWISAQYYWRKGNLDVARHIITANQHLSETPMGQEALAIISSKQIKEQQQR